MASILISIAAKIAEYPVVPILHEFDFLFDYTRNVTNLSEQAERLKSLQLHVNQQVQRARSRGDIIESQVQRWLANVDQIIEQVAKIEEQSKTSESCFGGFCPNCVNRYRISRKSTKKVRSITELQEEAGNFYRISRPAPLPGIEYYSSSRNFIDFDTRIEAKDQILKALEEDECNSVVIHGTRGIGKTELAKEVGRRAKENLFDEVVMVFLDPNSSIPDLRNIQNQIADMLGFKIHEESDIGRARRLHLRLKNEKKILIIFDDVREMLNLEAIGIPSENNGCKIMITTEKENGWRAIMEEEGVKKVEIKALSEEESWRLFRSVTGEIVDNDPDLKVVAKEIVGKCKGLPLMIVNLGKRLKHRKIEQWKSASRIIGRLEAKTENLDEFLNAYI